MSGYFRSLTFPCLLLMWISMMTSQSEMDTKSRGHRVNCSELRMGQYLCDEQYDPKTQQLRGCREEGLALVQCKSVDGLICEETTNRTFYKDLPCKFTNGYRYDTALLLSVFLGFLGADRFYLGYVGMGTLKFCTLGFLFIGHLFDVVLIATQYLNPRDGSHYIVSRYGPSVEIPGADNQTFVIPREDWF